MICTLCDQPVEDGSSAIYGIERNGRLVFGWTCCHKPVGDVAVVLGSLTCCEEWLSRHPEYIYAVGKLLEEHAQEHGK